MYHRHGVKRMRERHGISKKGAERELDRVLRNGQTVDSFSGPLRRWLIKTVAKSEDRTVVVHARKVYIFADSGELVTTWPIPAKFFKKERFREYEFPVEEVSEA